MTKIQTLTIPLKSHHFVYVRALIVRDILRSKDAQYNSEESPYTTVRLMISVTKEKCF